MKVPHGQQIAKVREMCARAIGVSLLEACKAIERPMNIVSTYFSVMKKREEITRAGVHHKYRYFFYPRDAEVYDKKTKADFALDMEASKIRRHAANAKRERDKRARIRKEAGKPPYDATKANSAKVRERELLTRRPKCQNIVIESKQQSIDKKRQHQAATIIWPDNVVIQKIPTPEDTRFKPAPDYKGHFVKEFSKLRENPYMQA